MHAGYTDLKHRWLLSKPSLRLRPSEPRSNNNDILVGKETRCGCGGGGVCVGVWRGRHGVGACGQDHPTSVSTQPHNTAWRPQPTPGSMRAGRVQGTCLRVWGHTLKQ